MITIKPYLMSKYFIFILYLASTFNLISQNDTLSYYSIEVNDNCSFTVNIPNELQEIDSLVCSKYNIDYKTIRTYKYLINVTDDSSYYANLFSISIYDENDDVEICVLDKILKTKLIFLTNSITINNLNCHSGRFFVSIEFD